jgi:8-oxo-dGTP diphosphatase
MLIVAAALIESAGKLLVCQRRRGGAFELLWEFPGGKKRPDETPQEALARELAEELGITARIGREIYRTQHRYPQMPEPIELIFFAAGAPLADVRNRIFERIEWIDPASLPELNFLPADRELIEKLATGEISLEAIRPGFRQAVP